MQVIKELTRRIITVNYRAEYIKIQVVFELTYIKKSILKNKVIFIKNKFVFNKIKLLKSIVKKYLFEVNFTF